MSQPPLTVDLPHRLGKAEALARIKGGLTRARTEFASLLTIEQEQWEGDTVSFSVRALGQHAAGTITVFESSVRLVVTLPWLLAKFANAVQRTVGQKGQLLLEKK